MPHRESLIGVLGLLVGAVAVVGVCACGSGLEPAAAPLGVYEAAPVALADGAPSFDHVTRGARLGAAILGPEDFLGWRRQDRGDPHAGESLRQEAPYHDVALVAVLTDDGARRFEAATARLRGQHIAVTIDGRVTAMLVVQTAIGGGRVVLFEGRDSAARPVEAALRGR